MKMGSLWILLFRLPKLRAFLLIILYQVCILKEKALVVTMGLNLHPKCRNIHLYLSQSGSTNHRLSTSVQTGMYYHSCL